MTDDQIILLINRAIPYNAVGKVTGLSGVQYGDSFYSEAHAAHVCRMTLEDWRRCAHDVTHSPVQRWLVDVELPERPSGGEDVVTRIREANEEQLEAIVSGLGPVAQAIFDRLKTSIPVPGAPLAVIDFEVLPASKEESDAAKAVNDMLRGVAAPFRCFIPKSTGLHTAESLSEITNYRQLLKVAKEAGVENADNIDNTMALRVAILAKQLLPA